MAEADWTELTNSLSDTNVARGVYAGISSPNGGGTFVYGLNTLTSTIGAVGLRTNQTNFDPLLSDAAAATGGVVSGVLRREGTADTGWSCFLFIGLQGTDVTDTCYMLGLSDAAQSRLILRKGILSGGVPDLTPDPTVNGNLLASVATFPKGTYVHAELQAIVQGNGDTLLKVRTNDLGANPVTAPVWATPVGMEGPGAGFPSPIVGFIDDALTVATGSAPLAGGRVGFGIAITAGGAGKRAFIDHVAIARQTTI